LSGSCGRRLSPSCWSFWFIAPISPATKKTRSFLDDSANHQKKEQEELLAKVNKIQPLIRIVTGATCVLTVCILGVYVWDALQHLM
jgi:hypothetical protein